MIVNKSGSECISVEDNWASRMWPRWTGKRVWHLGSKLLWSRGADILCKRRAPVNEDKRVVANHPVTLAAAVNIEMWLLQC